MSEHPSATIYDIAKRASASPATVSRVLSKSDYRVSDKLKKRIMQAAEELNYIPNEAGRQLKTKKSLTIGVLIPSISNPFYSSVVTGIEEIAFKQGYNVLLCNTQQSVVQEAQCLQMVFERQIAGLIISPLSDEHPIIDWFVRKGVSVVAFDQWLHNRNVFQIDYDYKKGGYLAAQHLIDKGHERIAYLTAPFDRPSRRLIYEGYKQALLDNGIALNNDLVLLSDPVNMQGGGLSEFANGQHLAAKLLGLPQLPTAVFACNDMTAFGVLHVLNQHRIRVPEDVSLVGFDNIEFGEMANPPLTSIEQPKVEQGRLACNILLGGSKGFSADPRKIVLQPKLVERSSVYQR